MYDLQWTDSGRFLPEGFESEPTFYELIIELPSWLEDAPDLTKQEYFSFLEIHISGFLSDCLKTISQEK